MEISESDKEGNWTIIRVWLPKDKTGSHRVAHAAQTVGHASLQTRRNYASFWPDPTTVTKGPYLGALFGTAHGLFHHTLQEDLKAKTCEPDVIVVLYTLEVDLIDAQFETFLSSPTAAKWSLMGRNVFNVFNKGGGQSCSGLVYDLLNAGKISKIIGWDMVSSWWTVAPDAVARVAVAAATSEPEVAASSFFRLPPGINSRITKPDYDLNPHKWPIGYGMSQPKIKSNPSLL